MNRRISIFAAALAVMAGGCAVGPDYSPPDDAGYPAAFSRRLAKTAEDGNPDLAILLGNGALPNEVGFFALGDNRLAALQKIASTNNLGILQVVKRIDASRASLAATRAGYWPNIGFGASTSKTKNFNPESDGERSSLRFDASWELDLFGRVRRSAEAAQADLESAGYGLGDAMLSLQAEIASEYVNFCLRRQLWQIAKKNIELQKEFLKIASEKFDSGLGSEFDLQTAKAQLQSALAASTSAEAEVSSCVRRLESLCSLPPCSLNGLIEVDDLPMPIVPAFPPEDSACDGGLAAVVSDVMRKRPDVRKSERDYAAALARVGVATANYFPTVSIGAGLSMASNAFASWGNAVRSIDFGPSLNWNIFTFGRTKAQVAQARAKAEESALAYRETVLTAYHEIENALEAQYFDSERCTSLERAFVENLNAEQMARKSYEEGLGEYRDLLSSSQSRLSSERSLAEIMASVILDKIALAKSLAFDGKTPINEQEQE